MEVIESSPNPTEKLSKETPNANKNIPILLNLTFFTDGFKYSINICREIKINIIPNIKSVFKFIIFVNNIEVINPKIGIMK